MYGRDTWLARNTTPYTMNRRRTTGSASTLRIARTRAGAPIPAGITSGRISWVPTETSSAVPTENSADSA